MTKKQTTRPIRILLADDHAVTLRGLRALLETDPTFHIVGQARDGIEALRMVEELKPEIIILDISMPELNGLDVARKLRREAPAIKVIILTMHFSEDVARECLRAGARAYVLKSDADCDLIEAVRTVRDDRQFLTPRITEIFNAYQSTQQGNPDTPRGLDGEIPIKRLTPREQEVVAMLCDGMSNKEVASQIGASTRTVESHRNNIMDKLQITAFSELVRYAVRHGVVRP